MADNLHKDNLEKFFHDRLQEHREEPEIDLWEQIEGKIPPPRRHRWWTNRAGWIVGVALVAVLVGVIVVQQKRIEEISQKVENQKVELKVTQEKIQTFEQEIHPTTEEKMMNVDGESPIVKGGVQHPKTASTPLLPPLMPRSSRPLPHQGLPKMQSLPTLVKSDSSTSNGEPKISLPVARKENPNKILMPQLAETFVNTDFLSMKRVFLDVPSLLVQPSNAPKEEPKQPTAALPAPYFGGISVKQQYGRQHLKGKPHDHLLVERFKKEERLLPAFSTAVRVGKNLTPNWSVYTGLEYAKMALELDHRGKLVYSNADETAQPDGSFDKNYAYTLPTSGGDLEVTVPVKRLPNASFNNGDSIPFQLKIQQETRLAKVPVVVQYETNGRLRFGAKLGVVASFATQTTAKLDQIDLFENGITKRTTEQIELIDGKFAKPKTVSLNYLAGLRLAYVPIPKIQLFLEPTVEGGLTAMKRRADSRAYPVLTGIEVGVVCSF